MERIVSVPEDEPLQLIEFIRDTENAQTTMKLVDDTLGTITQRAGSRPISIVCICGPSRQGKSFVLGYLIRYLNALEKDETDWFGWNDRKKPLDGFRFRNGSKPETKGIWVWSRPFIVKTDDNKEVAVLLIYTQGTHDEFTTAKDMSSIVGLSLLTSSIMIFNCFNDVHEDVLSSLNTYMQYGQLVLDIEKEKKAFQKLVFLVRDWNNPGEYPFGPKGGRTFLKKKLKEGHHKEAKGVGDAIRNCYEDLECFLMPYIGDKALYPEFTGSVGELESKFAQKLEQLIVSLLSPEEMVPKEILGLGITAKEFKEILQMYLEIFNTVEEEVSPTALLETTCRFHNEKVLKLAFAKFTDVSRRKMRGSTYIALDEIDDILDFGEKTAFDLFQKESKFSSEAESVGFKKKLQVCLRREKRTWMKSNEASRNSHIQKLTEATVTNFRSLLERKFPFECDQFFEDECIQQTITPAKEQALEDLRDTLDNESEQGLREILEALGSILDEITVELVSRNNANRAAVTGLIDLWFIQLKEKVDASAEGKGVRDVSVILGKLDSAIASVLKELSNNENQIQREKKCTAKSSKEDLIGTIYSPRELHELQEPENKLQMGIAHVFDKYKSETNYPVLDFKTLELDKIQPLLVTLYHEDMKCYMAMADAPFHPSRLVEVHKELSGRLVAALKNACRSDKEKVGQVLVSLQFELAEAFKSHQSSNELKLKKLQMEVAEIAEKLKSEYHRKCEDIFTKYPDGVDAKTLGKLHEAICVETKKLLEMEIRNKIRTDEPVESCTCALQKHMESFWKTVLEVNRKNLTLKQERDKQAERYRLKEESRRQLQGKENKLRSGSESSTNKQYTAVPISRPIHKQQDHRQVLPPLVLHFRSTDIVMGMKGFNEPIPNESKELRTPAFVLVTPENEIIYGSAALALVEADTVPENLQGGCFWTITDLFLTPDKNLNKDVYIDSHTYTITHEFLLGFIFRKLKDTAEQQINGRCTQALIVVPFWLSSTQRLRVKHAAMLAGFSEAFLINEAAAAAYNFAIDTISRQGSGRALVLTENLDRVDAFVYEYQTWCKRLRLVCHSSNYHNTKGNKGLTKQLTGGFNNLRQVVDAFWYDEKSSEVDKIKTDVREACRKVTSHNSNLKGGINEVLCICGNERKWADLMNEVASGFGKKAVGINEKTAVMTAAISLCSNISHLGLSVCDKLIANVERRANYGTLGGTIISGNDHLPQEVKLVVSTPPSSYGDFCVDFYQEICNGIHAIGSLKITDTYREKLEVRVQITYDGVVTLKDVMTGRNSKYETRSCLSPDRYTWEPEMLKPMEFEKQLKLLEVVIGPKVDSELIQAKEVLLLWCTELEDKLNQGVLTVRSDLVKDHVRKKILEARRFGNHPHVKLDQVDEHLDTVKALFNKYAK